MVDRFLRHGDPCNWAGISCFLGTAVILREWQGVYRGGRGKAERERAERMQRRPRAFGLRPTRVDHALSSPTLRRGLARPPQCPPL
jgi:hypothetical protein